MTDWENRGMFRSRKLDPRYGRAAQHWRFWEKDLGLLKELGVNSYRFSIEWARLEPEEDRFITKALDQYERMLDRLLEYGITPMLTLHHFTHPTWFHVSCPWHSDKAVAAFVRFAETVVKRVADRVPYFVTVNEPVVWALAAYADAKFPPGFKDPKLMAAAIYNLLQAHREVYDLIKSESKHAQVGIAKNFVIFKTARKGHLLDQKMKRLIHEFYNLMMPQAFDSNCVRIHFPFLVDFERELSLKDKIDFWGINYYYRMHVRFRASLRKPFDLFFRNTSGEGFSDLGWEIYARGLQRVLNWMRFTNKPLFVTENGIAAQDDSQRMEFMSRHLAKLEKAIEQNPQVKGYFHWSLLDNYEWLVGYRARFGLYEVDFTDGYRRTIRDSGRYFANYIRKHQGKPLLRNQKEELTESE